ncbi:MAG: AAA family ATPase [Bacteroidia bacterium]
MPLPKLGIGSQTFQLFSKEKMIYVDKTELIYKMMDLGIHNFIVRPRRFGKSLFLDTVGTIYEAKKEQFEGTWIYNNLNWEEVKRPVLRIDFTKIEYNACTLEEGLQNYLLEFSDSLELGLSPNQTAKDLFRKIISALGKETTIVILIDEYRGARKQQITLDEMERIYASGKLLKSANLTQFYSLSLLFQAGYLTIKEVLGDDDYVLGFPNQEVRESYASYLLAEYVEKD